MNKNKCLISDCEGNGYSRGLCGTCYAAAVMKVKSLQTNWAELERIGLSQPRMRKENKFVEAFNRKK